MPNSTWTETGLSINLVPVTSPVAPAESVDYLTNGDKIQLMSQYAAELATKTQLDTQAAALGVSSTAYDNAVANINTTLVTAGAPSNWATIWPDGTTSGPWLGIQTDLANDWSAIATERAALQSALSSQQAGAAKAVAIAAAASESLIPNGGFATGDLTGWTAAVGDTAHTPGTFGTFPNSSAGMILGSSAGMVSAAFQVIPGKKYKLLFWAFAGSGSQSVTFRVFWKQTQAANILEGNKDGFQDFLAAGTIATTATYYAYDWTPGTNENYASVAIYQAATSSPANIYVGGVFCIPYLEAGYIDAGAITADDITTGTLNASTVDVINLDASNITTGTLSATMVLFPDGTSVSGASRVQNQSVQVSSVTVSTFGSTPTSITGLAFTVTSFGATDSYLIIGLATGVVSLISGSGSPGATIGIFVDGNTSTNYAVSFALTGTVGNITFVGTITGLSAGSHTIQAYADPGSTTASQSVDIFSAVAICQRTY